MSSYVLKRFRYYFHLTEDKLLSISKKKKGGCFLNNFLTEIVIGLRFSPFDRGEHFASFYGVYENWSPRISPSPSPSFHSVQFSFDQFSLSQNRLVCLAVYTIISKRLIRSSSNFLHSIIS